MPSEKGSLPDIKVQVYNKHFVKLTGFKTLKIKGKIIIRRLFVLIVFFIICNQHFVGARMNMLSTAEVVIHHEPSLINAAQETAELYKESKVTLEKIFGWQYEEKANVVIVKNNNEFKMITGYSYIVALAVPQRHLIIIDYSKMSCWPFFLERTLSLDAPSSYPRWTAAQVAR
jgi:hypothetical protein